MSGRVRITPVGDARHNLMSDVGLVAWHYLATPVADEIEGVPVWLFDFTRIEETRMQEYLVQRFKTMFRMTRSKALEWLCTDRITIPQAHVNIQDAE